MTPTAILVIGMHRSGTSALTGVLGLLGVDLGGNLLPANEANARGYWEHAGIYDIHERLLAALGSDWADPLPLAGRWWKRNAVRPFRDELQSVIQRDFAESSTWAVKDPRLWKLLPLWKDVLAESGVAPAMLIPTRHPVEIAESLEARDHFKPDRSYRLWLNHVLCTETATRGFPRAFTTYSGLLEDWRVTVARIAEALDIQWAREPDHVAKKVEAFLSSDLRHHTAAEGPARKGLRMPSLVELAHECLERAATDDDPENRRRFSEVRSRVRELNELMSGLEVDHRELRAHSEELEAKVGKLEEEMSSQIEEEQRLAILSEELAENLSLEKDGCQKLEAYCRRLEEERLQLGGHVRELEAHCRHLEEGLSRIGGQAGELENYCKHLEEEISQHESQAEGVGAYCKRLEEEISQHEGRAEGLEDYCRRLEDHLARLKVQSVALEEYSRGLERDITQLGGHSEKLATYAKGLESDLQRHVATEQEHSLYSRKLEKEISQLQSHAEELESFARGLEEERSRQSSLVGDLRAHATNLEAESETLRGTVEKLSGDIAAAGLEKEELQGVLAKLRTELAQVETTIAKIRTSRSWRITRPLRRTAVTIRRIGRVS